MIAGQLAPDGGQVRLGASLKMGYFAQQSLDALNPDLTVEEQLRDVRLILATREEEAFGIAAGLYLGGRLPTVMLQSSGLGNSLNALTSLLMPYQIPVLMVVSMRGDAGDWNAAQVPMGRAVRGIFESIGVPHTTVESADAAADTVRLAGRTAFGTRTSRACLLPRRVTAIS